MPTNLLVLPLLAGYWLVSRANFRRYKLSRSSGQELLFESFIAGLSLLAVCRLFVESAIHFTPDFAAAIKHYLPYDYLGTCILTIPAAMVIASISNRLVKKTRAVQAAILESNNPIEIIFYDAYVAKRPVMVILQNRMVYVGNVLRGYDPRYERNAVEILPALSGFRDDEFKVKFRVNYAPVMRDYIERRDKKEGAAAKVLSNSFRLCIRYSEIETVRFFDLQAYRKFQELEDRHSAKSP